MNRNELNSLKESIHQTVLNDQKLFESSGFEYPSFTIQPGDMYPTSPAELPPFIRNPDDSLYYNWQTDQWFSKPIIINHPGYPPVIYDWTLPGAIKPFIEPYWWWSPTFYPDDTPGWYYPLAPSGHYDFEMPRFYN